VFAKDVAGKNSKRTDFTKNKKTLNRILMVAHSGDNMRCCADLCKDGE
jgi:hypothetical protein